MSIPLVEIIRSGIESLLTNEGMTILTLFQKWGTVTAKESYPCAKVFMDTEVPVKRYMDQGRLNSVSMTIEICPWASKENNNAQIATSELSESMWNLVNQGSVRSFMASDSDKLQDVTINEISRMDTSQENPALVLIVKISCQYKLN